MEKVDDDLEAMSVLSAAGRAPAIIGFHAQQAAEKALKALLVHRGEHYPKTHDLLVLARLTQTPDDVFHACEILSPAYVASRYPEIQAVPDLEEARELEGLAKEVVAWVRRQL